MKKQYWLIFFIVLLIVHIVAIQLNIEWLRIVSKPLLLPVLGGYFLFTISGVVNNFKKWILLALLFSWIGDVLLMFVSKNEIFFLLGLSSFLLAHVCYIIFFHSVRVKERVKSKPLLLLPVAIYYGVLIYILAPYLQGMKIPVRVYGLVISFMFMLALHMLFIQNKMAGRWMMVGALLFVISDSVLAINKFYQPFKMADIIIMLTYGIAQLFIVKGAIGYVNSIATKKVEVFN
jgi:uncharacterized membrane protein YhhN